MFKHILFDLDGTLTDPGLGITSGLRIALQKMGFPVPPQKQLESFIGPPLGEMFMQVCGLTKVQAAKAIDLYREYYREKGLLENYVYPGIPQLLARLQKKGCQLHLATSKPLLFAGQIMDHFKLSQYFTLQVGSPMAYTSFAKAQLVAQVVEKAKIKNPATAIMVGDRLYDVQAAQENHLACIGVLYGYGSKGELQQAGADYLAKDVPALEVLLCS